MGKGGTARRAASSNGGDGYDDVEEIDYESIAKMQNLPENFRNLHDPVSSPSTRVHCELFAESRTGKRYKVEFVDHIQGGLAATDMKDKIWLNPRVPRFDAPAEIRMVTMYGYLSHEISHILWNRQITMQRMLAELGDPSRGGEGKLDPREYPSEYKWHIKNLLNVVLDGNCEWRTFIMKPNLFGFIHAANGHSERACFETEPDELIAWYDEFSDPPQDPRQRAARNANLRKISEKQLMAHQAFGALLYEALPDFAVPYNKLFPKVIKALEECRPHLERGVLGTDPIAYDASKEIFKVLLKYDLLEPLKANEKPPHFIIVSDAHGSQSGQQVSLEQVLKDGGKIVLVRPKGQAGSSAPQPGAQSLPGQGQGQPKPGQQPGQGGGSGQEDEQADPKAGSTGGRLAEEERRKQGLDPNGAPSPGQSGQARQELDQLREQIESSAERAEKDAAKQVESAEADNKRRVKELNEMFGGKGSKEIEFPQSVSDEAALYQRDRQLVTRERSYFAEELRKVLEEGIGMQRFLEQGMLNPEMLVAGSLGEKEIFRDIVPQRQFDMEISILLDTSGSMSGVRDELQRMAILIASTCEELAIPCEVWSFGRAQLPFKGFDEDNPYRLGAIGANVDGGTPMLEGVLLADARIRERSARSRILFIVTDGAPNGEDDAVPKIRRVLDDLIADGIPVFGVYVGEGQEDALKRIFKHFSICPTLAQVPDLVVDRLVKVLEEAIGLRKRG